MSNDNVNEKKENKKLSGTLSLGKSLDDIKKNIEKKESRIPSKRQTIVEVLSKKKIKKSEAKVVDSSDLPKVEDKSEKEVYIKEFSDSQLDMEKNLTKQEQQNRLRVLEESKQKKVKENIFDRKEELTFTGPSVISKAIERKQQEGDLDSEEEYKRDKKEVHVKHSPTKDIELAEITDNLEEEKNIKKRVLTKKKVRTDEIKNWRDAIYYDDESEDDTTSEDNIEVEDNTEKTDFVFKQTVDMRRKGKTKRDKSKKRVDNGIKYEVIINGNQSVKDLAHKMSEKLKIVLDVLKKLGFEATEDTILDIDVSELLLSELGHIPIRKSLQNEIEAIYSVKDSLESLVKRPPVVTIMGHVDHGKTSLLDYIRKTNVVSKESGGITQHIGAYQISDHKGNKITFLDTPGHEAFTEMRARGASITDIVVLVVAADDGIKPQSIEAINHAQSANVPIIVAINKIDKPGSNSMKVKTELLQHNVVVEEMGGEVLSVEISAIKGTGISNLVENIILLSEVLDLKANSKRQASGVIIESKIEKGKGFVGSVIIKNGTLKQGDIFVSGISTGRVRLIVNDLGKVVKQALPGDPVEVTGFNYEVFAGDDFIVVSSEVDANKIVNFRKSQINSRKDIDDTENDDENQLLKTLGNDKKKLSIIIKTDVHGSKEAIVSSLYKIIHDEVEIKIVHSGIGQITESDVLLAKISGAVIYGFNVRANNQSKILASKEKIDIRYYSIIYDLIDDVRGILGGLLNPKSVENITGYAEVREVFNITKVGKIAGCYVTEGLIKKAAFARVLRNGVVMHEGVLSQLKRFKDDVKEVRNGYECGIMFQNFQDLVVGDIIECFEKNMIERTL